MYRRAAIILLIVVFLVNVFRAWTQSITTDEAFTHGLFLGGSWDALFNSFDACHHVLHTILCKLSISLFGLSEFTLRLPSLLGGLLYLLAAFRISRHLFGEGPLFLLSTGLLSLNPLVLDMLSAARGYGLALGLFLWALYQMLLYTEAGAPSPGSSPDRSLVLKAGLGLGLSVAANLTLLVPAAALAGLFLVVLAGDPTLGAAPTVRRRLSWAFDSLLLPAIVTAFVIVILPLTKAQRGNFYVGESSLAASLQSLLAPSLYHHPLSHWQEALILPPRFWLAFLGNVFVPAILAAAALSCLVVLYRWIRARTFAALDRTSQYLFLGAGTLLLSLAGLIMANRLFQVLYPYGRTGLYLIPLFTLTALVLPSTLRGSRIAWIAVGLPIWIAGLACLGHFLVQFQTTHYAEWRFDASTKKIVGLIRDRQANMGGAKVRVAVTWPLEPSVNFYRKMYKLDWMEPPDRKGPDRDAGYYVLLREDRALIGKRGLSVLYSDEFSGASLAIPAAAATP